MKKINAVAPEEEEGDDDGSSAKAPRRSTFFGDMFAKMRRGTNLRHTAIKQRQLRRGSTNKRPSIVFQQNKPLLGSKKKSKDNSNKKDRDFYNEQKMDAFLSKPEVLTVLNHFMDKVETNKHRKALEIELYQGTAVAARQDPFTVPCDANWRVNWDMFTMCLIFYVAIMQPFRFGFEYESPQGSAMWFFETALDFVFMFDLCLNFRK